MLAIASGCGGSSSSKTTAQSHPAASTPSVLTEEPAPPVVKVRTGKPLPRAQWIAKADAICAHLSDQLAATRAKSLRDLARVLPQVVVYERTALGELAQLIPPARETRDWQQFLASGQLWAQDSALVAKAVQAPGFTLASPLPKAANHAHENLMAVAKRNGFKDCAEP